MPLAIVAATWSDRKAPTKLRTAAMVTATRGGIARVEIEVATALAVSWKPFVKSKASAVPTTIQRTTSSMPYRFLIITPSRMLAARSVESMASSRRSKMSFQRMTIIGSIPVSNSDASASRTLRSPSFSSRLISTVKWRMSPNVRRRGNRVVQLAAGVVEDPREVLRLVHRRLDAVQREVVGDLLDEVDDVVQRGGEVEDVLALDRRHERRVEALDDVVRDPVALLLADHDLAGELAVVGPAVEHALEDVAGLDDVAPGLLEQVKELALPRREQTGQACHRRASVVVKRIVYACARFASISLSRSISSGATP